MMSSQVNGNRSISAHQQWPARDHVAIFVRCLHLLDLDLLEDWPDVTEHLFTAKTMQQHLQQRVKAVEWSLFRLFEKYDPNETRDRLRPFFPPTTQLQSLNLRAAIYRSLTELKKNGVLGRDVTLRKTMLDDCNGERFEEVIAGLAMVVLRKTRLSSGNRPKRSVKDNQLLPLVLAHRVSLQNLLQDRREVHQRSKQNSESLRDAESHLQHRLAQSQAVSVQVDVPKQDNLHTVVNSSWIGNTAWMQLLFCGTPPVKVLETVDVECYTTTQEVTQKRLHDFDDRIQKHKERLSEWKIIAKDLAENQSPHHTSMKPTSRDVSKEHNLELRFLKHKTLAMSDSDENSISQLPMDEAYAKLIGRMNQELDMISSKQKPSPTRKLASQSPLLASKVDDEWIASNDGHYQQEHTPNAEVARDLLPPVPGEETDEKLEIEDSFRRSVSPIPMHSSIENSPWILKQQDGLPAVDTTRSTPAKEVISSTSNSSEAPVSPSKVWMSLAERTRASMSLTGRSSILTDPESPNSQLAMQSELPTLPELYPPSDDERRTTLLERTRKSMSIFAASSAIRPRKTKPEKRVSEAYPVNQFETPNRLQRPSEWTPSSGATTPREELFDDDAEYASVFKSRPKIALSPAFSPQRRTSGLGSILEQDMDRLNLNSENEID